MNWTSILAIYFLVWVMSAFVMLPFGVKTADEAGVAKVPGQAESAPVNFRPGRVAGRGAVIAAILTGLYVANYEFGWIGVEALDVTTYFK
jgi:predicted secreted protein